MPMGCAYEVVIPIARVNGAIVSVLTIWTVLEGDSTPRLARSQPSTARSNLMRAE
jgi:hypothetical protein